MSIRNRKRDPEKNLVRICAKSFFRGALSRRHRARKRATMAAASLSAALILTGIFVNSQICYAVYMNGEVVGQVKSKAEATEIISGAEKRLTKILGYDYSLGGAVSVSADLGEAGSRRDEVETAIIAGVSGVRGMYAMEVGGEIAGASENPEELFGVLKDIIAEYTTENTTDIKFMDNITVRQAFVSADTCMDMSLLRTLLEPSNKSSKYALTVESTRKERRTEDVPFTIEEREDDTIYVGDSYVFTPGEHGQTLITESNTYINGVLRSALVLDSVVIKAPVTQVVAVGTKPLSRSVSASAGGYIWPAAGVITSGFGYRQLSGRAPEHHKGIDIAGVRGQSIVAAADGVVTYAGILSTYGELVKIQHGNGDETYYAHCSRILVSVGERVSQGQEIAKMGMTGNATGVHCHFEIRKDGTPVNPLDWLP